MKKLGVYIGGQLVAHCEPVTLPLTESTSPEWGKVLNNPDTWELTGAMLMKFEDMQCDAILYMKRKGSYYFRNSNGTAKLTLTGKELEKMEAGKLKYGDKVNMKWHYK